MGNKNSYRGMKDNIDIEDKFSINFYYRSDDGIKIEYYTNAEIEIFNALCIIRKDDKKIMSIHYGSIQSIHTDNNEFKYVNINCYIDNKLRKYNFIFKKDKRGKLFFRNLSIKLYNLAKELNFITDKQYEYDVKFYKKLVKN
jgi:hypothetical protein